MYDYLILKEATFCGLKINVVLGFLGPWTSCSMSVQHKIQEVVHWKGHEDTSIMMWEGFYNNGAWPIHKHLQYLFCILNHNENI